MTSAPSFDSQSGPEALTQSRAHIRQRKPEPRDGMLLRLIAVFKFLKAACLVALSVGVFHLMHQDVGARLEHWVLAMRLDPGNRYVEMLLVRASNLSPAQVKKLGLAGLLYAGLFLVEGTGLWLQKRWGEWATVVITGTLIPFEVYEIFRHPSVLKIVVLVVNVGVVGYLIYRIRTSDNVRG
jgi:uncharacterized membrane protein (DUF2068 family)